MVKATYIPHIVKYMGSKRNLIDFVIDTIQEVDPAGDKRLYDVFAGSSVVGGAFRNMRPVTSNDIQKYSSTIASIYLQNYDWSQFQPNVIESFVDAAMTTSRGIMEKVDIELVNYKNSPKLGDIYRIEESHKQLIKNEFSGFDHLFLKTFSGTYWSAQQCIDIDSIMSTVRTEKYKGTFFHNLVQGALMFSMAYCSQSTGHYAQYRDLTEDNVDDVLVYRSKSIFKLFKEKMLSLREYYTGKNNSEFSHEVTSLDFIDSIKNSKPNSIIYADPPYQFVHYSRFYHALETLVRYDYPKVKFKGRYRTDRHQSPFCIRTKVKDAFRVMFEEIVKKNSILVLSYSDNGMISLDSLIDCAEGVTESYEIKLKKLDYLHSTMGRQKDKYRSVKEIIIIYKKKD